MNGPGTTPSPWGEPLGAPAGSAPVAGRLQDPAPRPPVAVPAGGSHRLRPTAAAAHEHGRLFRTVRSGTALLVIAMGLGLALAATLGVVVWAIASALHHASAG